MNDITKISKLDYYKPGKGSTYFHKAIFVFVILNEKKKICSVW